MVSESSSRVSGGPPGRHVSGVASPRLHPRHPAVVAGQSVAGAPARQPPCQSARRRPTPWDRRSPNAQGRSRSVACATNGVAVVRRACARSRGAGRRTRAASRPRCSPSARSAWWISTSRSPHPPTAPAGNVPAARRPLDRGVGQVVGQLLDRVADHGGRAQEPVAQRLAVDARASSSMSRVARLAARRYIGTGRPRARPVERAGQALGVQRQVRDHVGAGPARAAGSAARHWSSVMRVDGADQPLGAGVEQLQELGSSAMGLILHDRGDVTATARLSAARERLPNEQDRRRGDLLAAGRLANVCSNRHDREIEDSQVQEKLIIRGAREHNLKDVSLDLPRDSLIVFTGLSGSGKSSPGVRHDLRRGPAALRRVAVGVRPPVPRPDGQARRRLHRGALARGLDRPEVHVQEPALHRRHDHRGLRLPPPALRARRPAALPDLRRARSSGRPRSRSSTGCWRSRRARRFQVLAPVIRGRKGEYVELFRQLQTQGFSRARVNGETHAPRRTRPSSTSRRSTPSRSWSTGSRSRRPPSGGSPTRSRPRSTSPAGWWSSTSSTCAAKDPGRELKFSEKMACPNDHPIDTDELEPRSFSFNSPVRRLPGVPRPRHPHGGRPRAGRPRPAGHPRRGRDPAVEPGARRRLLPAADGRAGRGARVRPQHALGGPPRQGAEVDPRRPRDQGARR